MSKQLWDQVWAGAIILCITTLIFIGMCKVAGCKTTGAENDTTVEKPKDVAIRQQLVEVSNTNDPWLARIGLGAGTILFYMSVVRPFRKYVVGRWNGGHAARTQRRWADASSGGKVDI
jgi:hypothetical protein